MPTRLIANIAARLGKQIEYLARAWRIVSVANHDDVFQILIVPFRDRGRRTENLG